MTIEVKIMRGLPGSGKSRWASRLQAQNKLVFSADDFLMVDGLYQFDSLRLAEAHARCLRDYATWLTKVTAAGMNATAVVDNTGIRAWEISPYYNLALAFGAKPEIVQIYSGLSLPELTNRNIHGVPLDRIERMAVDMDVEKLPPFWTVTKIESYRS